MMYVYIQYDNKSLLYKVTIKNYGFINNYMFNSKEILRSRVMAIWRRLPNLSLFLPFPNGTPDVAASDAEIRGC